jgi:hypothetical protein
VSSSHALLRAAVWGKWKADREVKQAALTGGQTVGFSPFEILFGPSPPLVKVLQGDLTEIGDLTLRQQILALGLTLSKINDWVIERLPVSLTTPTHPYKPGDAVW